ncbi:MAG: thioredoxin [Cyanobium sp. NAT70]|nr:thioredoxin [Cyanobium sp. NAT70]MAR08862.1 thioredoxin [Blastopirellula sp.]|tara:strand:+ start:258 stop:812 length:555 start_codon:yes stop_codon:yes gene_type:complete
MTGSPQQPLLGSMQKGLLLAVAIGLAIMLLIFRGGLQTESPMEQLARRSLEPDVALANGRPTILEFYADWCQACRAMAPAMLSLEQASKGRLDVVLVNVDNPRWEDLIEQYDVNGIPQLELFSADGRQLGRSIGVREPDELMTLGKALIDNNPLPKLRGVGSVSALSSEDLASRDPQAGPRSHG